MKTLRQHIAENKTLHQNVNIQEKLIINKDMKPTPPEKIVNYLVDDYLSNVPYKYGKGSVSKQFKTKEDFIKLIEDLGITYDTETRRRRLGGEIDREETLMILKKDVEARYMGGNIKFDKFVIVNCHKNGEEPGCWMIWTEIETKGYASSSGMVVAIQERINWDMNAQKKILTDADKSKEMKAYYTGMSNDKIEWLKELLADTSKHCSDYVS